MKRYVAILTAALLLGLAAAAQSKATAPAKAPPPANFGSAHGLCGPDHPNIEALSVTVGDGPPPTVRLLTAISQLIFVGRPSLVRYAATASRMYTVVTLATFPHPLVLKALPVGARSGQPVVMRFAGGVALVDGTCTWSRARATAVRAGTAYLVFASPMAGPGSELLGTAYPIDAKSSELMPAGGGSTPLPPRNGHRRRLLAVIREVQAIVAGEIRGSESPSGPRR